MASDPITSWKVKEEKVEAVTDFIFLGSKIIVDDNYNHEIKSCLLLGRNAMTNLNSILKSRDITLLTKVCILKAMVFPVVMYGCESQTIKKAKRLRIDAFKLWCWRRLLRVSWIARRLNQSILQEINPEYSFRSAVAEAEVSTLGPHDAKGQLIGKKPYCWKRLKAKGEGTDRGWDG